MSTNVMVTDSDIAQGNFDSHRLEVIAEGFSLEECNWVWTRHLCLRTMEM